MTDRSRLMAVSPSETAQDAQTDSDGFELLVRNNEAQLRQLATAMQKIGVAAITTFRAAWLDDEDDSDE